ncbi:MAG: FAD-dependent monooxygenase [Chloroflexi bacterium]|nr:FAD-dependent monooxygenase [Chloroflexota bacterium]MBP7041693.1 FAD-dependent monooxygenase [Chloroflexota bacterium]
MAEVQHVDVLIVGSGPSGTSTALHLVKSRPDWAGRIVVVDKAVHPREKLCGGGITHMGRNVLTRLGLTLEPRHFDVREARLVYQDKSYSFYGDPVFTVVRRDEFDHWLVQTCEKWGIQVRQGEAVRHITLHDEYVEVVTEQAVFHAQTLVAADGSRSFVRQALKWDDASRVARLVEVLTPENAQQDPIFQDRVAVFEFTQMSDYGLQGYYWDFPSYVGGRPFMNRGLFDSRVRSERPKADLKVTLRAALADRQRDLEEYKLKGHPIRWWDRNGRFSMPRVLLVGDAAGADPLMGEGISFALGYGQVAAQAINQAFERQDFSYAAYRSLLLTDPLFIQLDRRTRLAHIAYKARHPFFIRLGWQAVRFFIRFTRWGNPDYKPLDPPELYLSGPINSAS